jgi:hypothetical protein
MSKSKLPEGITGQVISPKGFPSVGHTHPEFFPIESSMKGDIPSIPNGNIEIIFGQKATVYIYKYADGTVEYIPNIE